MTKVSDYIVEYLFSKGVSHVFGYPGGMVTHIMNSLAQSANAIATHINYHEQACAFAGCGYAQASGKLGVVFATSGPGATNLITGICNAYYDSTPVLFLTGQVNTTELKGNYNVRQRGFQETNIVQTVESFTKFAVQVGNKNDIKYCLDKAIYYAEEGRKGPVLLDIPMNIQREEVEASSLRSFIPPATSNNTTLKYTDLSTCVGNAKRPCILLGAGVKIGEQVAEVRQLARQLKIPFVSSMIGVDLLAGEDNYFGFIGAYGHRIANFIVAKSDIVISIGTRLDVRQVGGIRHNFSPNAQIVRFDIDKEELNYKIRDNDINICCDVKDAITLINSIEFSKDSLCWLDVAKQIRDKLDAVDSITIYDSVIKKIISNIPANSIITTDVGQNQVWVAQNADKKMNVHILFSGGHGAMGYSLPASIGAYYADGKRIYSFNGDGGFQMNIQELQYISSQKLPITIIVINNHALGMIRHFQEMYFNNEYSYTVEGNGYSVPNLSKIASAYGLEYHKVFTADDVQSSMLHGDLPILIEVDIPEQTYVYPKLEFGKPNQDQEPLIDRELFIELMDI